MAETEGFGRELTAARVAQGFRTQAQLDAFYTHYDHQKTCQDCRQGAYLSDDGWQPCVRECPAGTALALASFAVTR